MNEKTKLWKMYATAIFISGILIIIDQWTKYLAIINLKGTQGYDVWKGVFKLYYLENNGAAFGILQDQKVYFVLSALLILILVIYLFGKMPLTTYFIPLRICGILFASGAVGNMIDRIRLNYVVDFFYFELINFPIFNVADIYVVIAAGLLMILILFYYKEEDLTFLSFKKKS